MLKSTECKTPLATRMLQLAEFDNLPKDHPLRVHAVELEDLTPNSGAKAVLGRWARAKRALSDYSGEPLI